VSIHFLQLLCFWTLSIVLSLSKNTILFIFRNNISETGFCLRLQVKPTQLVPIDRGSPYLRTPVPATRWGIPSQAKHKPSARAKKILIFKLCMYEALHQRTITIEIITGERRYNLWYQHKKTKFPTQSTLDDVVVYYFCCDNGGLDGTPVITADPTETRTPTSRSSSQSLYQLEFAIPAPQVNYEYLKKSTSKRISCMP
jgi:hypothetical protein